MSNIKTALESAIEEIESYGKFLSAIGVLIDTAKSTKAVEQCKSALEELERANKLLEADAKTNYDFIQQVWLAHPNVDLDIDAMEKSNE